jgi:hypothetical protein
MDNAFFYTYKHGSYLYVLITNPGLCRHDHRDAVFSCPYTVVLQKCMDVHS